MVMTELKQDFSLFQKSLYNLVSVEGNGKKHVLQSAGSVNFRGTRGPTVGPERRRKIVQSDVWYLM
jgi:hypothetical protein